MQGQLLNDLILDIRKGQFLKNPITMHSCWKIGSWIFARPSFWKIGSWISTRPTFLKSSRKAQLLKVQILDICKAQFLKDRILDICKAQFGTKISSQGSDSTTRNLDICKAQFWKNRSLDICKAQFAAKWDLDVCKAQCLKAGSWISAKRNDWRIICCISARPSFWKFGSWISICMLLKIRTLDIYKAPCLRHQVLGICKANAKSDPGHLQIPLFEKNKSWIVARPSF